ncbi:MAG: glycosyltransferase family 4 protein, partial [Actinomycetia bacterium]|nr:glycosyltransferase family 4 protein [Actinomycetes bacterium]
DTPAPLRHPDPATDAAILLDHLMRAVHPQPRADHLWLLRLAVSSMLPTSDDVLATRRAFELLPRGDAALWLVAQGLADASEGSPARHLEIVTGGVVVDVDQTAKHGLHTGIQQVVRRVAPAWRAAHDPFFAAWTQRGSALRALTASEERRLLSWSTMEGASTARDDQSAIEAADRDDTLRLVVPWRGTLVLPETPEINSCDRLAALAEHSGNQVAAIGYDSIPITSAELAPDGLADRFARYLTVIKHCRRVVAISGSAAAEFQGFADMLPSQGLAGPAVSQCPLPTEGIEDPITERATGTDPCAEPTVLCVGSLGPHKNQLALLFAARSLWGDGHRFQLRLIGGSSWDDEVPRQVSALRGAGYPVTVEHKLSTPDLARAYRTARFTVFASLHEGFGLPVAESLACGTPVITSNFGATAEVGQSSGAVLVDPRDDDALIAAMRRLLVDDAELARLQQQTSGVARRSWARYADDVWSHLVPATGSGGANGAASDESAARR